MKKILIIGTLCLALMFAVSPAFAGMDLCGDFTPTSITIYKSNPGDDPPACDVTATVVLNGQTYDFDVTAYGTELNLAVLKAWNEGLTINGCMHIVIRPLTVDLLSLTF